jgi:hypothetical protein
MRNRLSWLAFPAAGFLGAVLCFLWNPRETTTSPGTETLSARVAAILANRTRPAGTDDPTPLAETEFTQALRSALLHSSGLHRRYALAGIAEQVGDRELPLLLQRCLEQTNIDSWVLAELWAERDPESAAAFWAKNPGKYRLSQAVVRGWVRRDPHAALAWVATLPIEDQLEHLVDLQQGGLEIGEPNPSEVMEAALQSYYVTRPDQAGAGITKLFTQWARHDPSGAKAFARGRTNENERRHGLMAVVSVLIETSPREAIELFGEIPMTEKSRIRPAADLAAQLAGQDLTLAMQFAQGEPEGQARATAIASIATVMIEVSPEKALALIDSVPTSDYSSFSISAFYEEWVKSDPATAFSHYIQRLEKMDPSSERYSELQRMLVTNLTRESPLRETAEFLTGQMDADRQDRLTDVLQRWIGQDSVGAADWADALPSGTAREHALAGVAKGKATQSVTAAVEWLGTLTKGPDYSAAVQGFASAVFSKDPDGALAWLKTIPNPAERQRRLREAWRQWAVSYSPTYKSNRSAAEQWRDLSPDLTPEERKELVVQE